MNSDLRSIHQALQFADHKHKDQRRKDEMRSPYINHPIEVVTILNEANIYVGEVIRAAFLHDTIEDTDTTYDELCANFGVVVADIVMELSDDKTLDKIVRKQLQIDHAAGASHNAKLVKLADKISNVRELINEYAPADWSFDRKLEYFDWAKDVVDELRGTNYNLEQMFDEAYGRRSEVFSKK